MARIDVRNDARGRSLAAVPATSWSAALAAVIFGGYLTAAIGVIPPWQNPDEPQHYMKAWLYTMHAGAFSTEWGDPDAERDIVRSMAEHGWWNHYGRPTPDPVPTTFAEGPALVIDGYFGPTPGGGDLYYRGVALLFRAGWIDGLLNRQYAMRCLSAVAALLMLPMVWLGTKELFGGRAALVATTMTALHPQVALVSTTAGPDAWVNLAGAAVWWQGARALRGTPSAFGWVLAAAVAGTLIRRMAAPLLLAALTIPIIRTLRARRFEWPDLLRLLRSTAPALLVLSLIGVFARGQLSAAFQWALLDPAAAVRTSIRRADDLPTFVAMFFRTFWISAGWLRHEAAGWVYIVIAAACLAATAGVVRALVRRAGDDGIVFAMVAVVLQIGATFAFHFGIAQTGPQGRYLFPVLPAVLALIWIGWRNCFRDEREAMAAVTLIAAMALFSTAAWTGVILRAYA